MTSSENTFKKANPDAIGLLLRALNSENYRVRQEGILWAGLLLEKTIFRNSDIPDGSREGYEMNLPLELLDKELDDEEVELVMKSIISVIESYGMEPSTLWALEKSNELFINEKIWTGLIVDVTRGKYTISDDITMYQYLLILERLTQHKENERIFSLLRTKGLFKWLGEQKGGKDPRIRDLIEGIERKYL